ncbi:MAG: hypothetical protein KatS3mg059_1496 [Thermomicrobiales bacterium]|nr:MAG: hypothetical protein KatS3mg059_1496 [Thermomicrobiales bacterium]
MALAGAAVGKSGDRGGIIYVGDRVRRCAEGVSAAANGT